MIRVDLSRMMSLLPYLALYKQYNLLTLTAASPQDNANETESFLFKCNFTASLSSAGVDPELDFGGQ